MSVTKDGVALIVVRLLQTARVAPVTVTAMSLSLLFSMDLLKPSASVTLDMLASIVKSLSSVLSPMFEVHLSCVRVVASVRVGIVFAMKGSQE